MVIVLADADQVVPTSAIAEAFQPRQLLHVTLPSRVMLALAGGAKTVVLAGPISDFSDSAEIDELMVAVSGYYAQAVVLQWHNGRGEAVPISGTPNKLDNLEELDDAAEHDSHVLPNEETSHLSSSRSLVTKEELAMLMQPLEIDPTADARASATQASGEQASGEEGRDSL